MHFYRIEQLDNTGLVSTVYTSKEYAKWMYGEDTAIDNYIELAADLGISPDDMVRPSQVHTSHVAVATREIAGTGVTLPTVSEPTDGLVTNEKQLFLCTREADCVPVYILDPVEKAVGMIHSGWRGTSQLITVNAIDLMEKTFSSKSENLMIAYGPSICKDCYEVGPELIEDFSLHYSNEIDKLFSPKDNGKYFLDVVKAIDISIEKRGVKPENIIHSSHCTYHDGIFSSYRLEKKHYSHMLTGIMLK